MAVTSELTPIKRDKTLSEHVYEQLKRSLMSGAFLPGQKLSSRSIAQAVGVSSTPAREALSRLIAEGALEANGPKTILVPRLTPRRLFEITQIRLLLEGLASEQAATRFDAAAVEDLERVQLALIAAMDRQDYKTVLGQNEVFHFAIYSRCDMPRLLSMIESLWLSIGPHFNLLYPEFRLTRAGINNHAAAIGAIKAGDAAALRDAMQQDIRDGFARLSRAIEEDLKH